MSLLEGIKLKIKYCLSSSLLLLCVNVFAYNAELIIHNDTNEQRCFITRNKHGIIKTKVGTREEKNNDGRSCIPPHKDNEASYTFDLQYDNRMTNQDSKDYYHFSFIFDGNNLDFTQLYTLYNDKSTKESHNTPNSIDTICEAHDKKLTQFKSIENHISWNSDYNKDKLSVDGIYFDCTQPRIKLCGHIHIKQ